jgi:uncharacterized membrane protein
MARRHSTLVTCPVCGQARRKSEIVLGEFVREPVAAEIRREHADWAAESSVCVACLNRYRADHVRRLLEEEKGELTALEREVIQSLREQESISADVNAQFDRQLSLGERLSDRLAAFGGSWTFLLLFAGCLLVWVVVNTVVLVSRPFDPYPFILLNLFLSCLAAIQAPIIMMSQNRQEAKDRLRSEHDYRVNLKAELEIRLLHAKLDQLLTHQWDRLLEIQQLQIDLMEELANRGVVARPSPRREGN